MDLNGIYVVDVKRTAKRLSQAFSQTFDMADGYENALEQSFLERAPELADIRMHIGDGVLLLASCEGEERFVIHSQPPQSETLVVDWFGVPTEFSVTQVEPDCLELSADGEHQLSQAVWRRQSDEKTDN